MNKKELEIKILELDPSKQNIIVVGKNAGLSARDLAEIPFPKKKEGQPRDYFILVNDVNNIYLSEVSEFLLKEFGITMQASS